MKGTGELLRPPRRSRDDLLPRSPKSLPATCEFATAGRIDVAGPASQTGVSDYCAVAFASWLPVSSVDPRMNRR